MSKESFASHPQADLSQAKLAPDSIGGRSILQHYEDIRALQEIRNRLDEHRDRDVVHDQTQFAPFLERELLISAHRQAITAVTQEFKPMSFLERKIHPVRLFARSVIAELRDIKLMISDAIPHKRKSSY